MSLEIGFNTGEAPGAVHPVDIAQFDAAGNQQGGIRVLFVKTT